MNVKTDGCETEWMRSGVDAGWSGYVMFGCGTVIVLWVDAVQAGYGIWWMWFRPDAGPDVNTAAPDRPASPR